MVRANDTARRQHYYVSGRRLGGSSHQVRAEHLLKDLVLKFDLLRFAERVDGDVVRDHVGARRGLAEALQSAEHSQHTPPLAVALVLGR